MCRSLRKLSFILIALMVTAGCSNFQTVAKKKRDLSTSSYYTVKKGDNLSTVGFRSGNGYKQLAKWNKIPPPYRIYPGQKLKLFSVTRSKKSSTKKRKKKKSLKTKKTTKSNKTVLKQHWSWPVKGKLLRGFYATGNKGIDIGGRVGKKIKAAGSGVVVYSGSGLAGYGKLLIIKHNYLYLSAYAHNRRLLVKEGQTVKKGQYIAEMGVGVNAKPSLHFEIRKNGTPVNPLNYLSKR